MDGLIGLLVVIGIGLISSSTKKKKAQQKAAQQTRAFRDAAEAMEPGKKPFDQGQWKQFLAQAEAQAKAPDAPKPKPPKPAKTESEKPKQAKPLPKPAAPKPAPLLHLENDEPEGTVSTQGESSREHAEHRQKILAEEEQRRLEHEALQEVRNMNLEKLRTAVVMSEVLGKPVSLRRRTR